MKFAQERNLTVAIPPPRVKVGGTDHACPA